MPHSITIRKMSYRKDRGKQVCIYKDIKKKRAAFHVRKKAALTVHTESLDGKINECVNTWNRPVKKTKHQQFMRTQCNFPLIIANVRP